jgi:hypothetical protein
MRCLFVCYHPTLFLLIADVNRLLAGVEVIEKVIDAQIWLS